MNKKIISLAIFTGLFGSASVALGQITNPIGSNTFPALLTKIADGVGTLIAGIGTIMIIVAGILYLLSAGSPEKVGTAKKAMIYAIAGIAIGISAKAIVEIVKKTIG